MLWFLLAFIFFVLWVSKKSRKKSDDIIDTNSKSYAQGYWDGARAQSSGAIDDHNMSEDTNVGTQNLVVPEVVNPATQIPVINASALKAKRDLQNINTTLYIASFLLVAAAALFIGTSLPESVRFVGVWFITIAFYVVGLVLHGTVEKLRPAAVAFVGTGLALLPFTGIAMFNFVLHDAAICWMVTSVVGLAAFIFAATQLRNQVVSYIAIAFGISLATSGVAVLHAGLLWYFVVSIVFGSLMTILAKVQLNLQWIPSCFARPIQESNKWIVPLTIIASMFAINGMTVTDYWIISLVSALYYGAVAASSVEDRITSLFLARLLASLSVVLIAYDVSKSWTTVGLAVSAVGVLQVFISTVLSPIKVVGDANNETWLWLGLAMQLFAPLFVWQDASWASIASGQLFVIILISFGLAFHLRRVLFSGFGTVSLMALPIILGRFVLVPALDVQWLALVFISFSAVCLAIRAFINQIERHPVLHLFLIANFGIFTMEALLHTVDASVGWRFGIWATVSALLYLLVYLERQPWFTLLANTSLVVASFWLVELMNVEVAWRGIIVSWIVFAIFYLAYWVSISLTKKSYGIYFLWSAIVVAGVINLCGLVSLDKPLVLAAGLSLVGTSIVMAIEGWVARKYEYITIATIAATIGLQRIVGMYAVDTNILVYTHWWAAMFAGLSVLYYSADKKKEAKMLSIVALSFVTFFSGLAALGAFGVSTMPYETIFLIEHVLILVFGLVISKKMFTTWGAVGIVLAVLKLIGFSYILLALVALGLIGAAIFALTKQSKNLK